MSSKVYSVGIRVTADVAGVTAALPQAQRALDTLGERAEQSSARASRGLGQVSGAADAAGASLGALAARSAQVQAMGEGFLAGLRDQVATFGKNTEELLRHRAAQLGVGQEASNLILQFQNQRAAQAAAAQAAQTEAQAQREAAQAKQAHASAQASFLAGLRDQVAVQGLSTADTLRYRAAQLGVAEGAESYIAALSASNNAHKMGAISAGQHAQALKYLPMQFTDVAVSIASGMPVWMVAIQQGGQIKDSFGGVGVAARETGRYVLGLLNPFTLTAAAMAVWAAGAYAGSQEARALQLAIIDSGNAAGVTQGQLMGMAAGVDAVVGTQGRAVEVLANLVATGQVGAAQLEAFTVAAVRLESVGGAAAEETAARFAELGKAPLQASLKLNESMNYLTASTYRQIKALMDQGRTIEAARVAQVAFADTLADRTSQMEANLGLVERGWRGIKSAVTEAWDAIKAIGRDAGPEGQLTAESAAIDQLKAQIEQRKTMGFNTQLLDAELVKLRERQSILQSDIRLRKSAAEAQAGQVRAAQQLVAWDQAGAQYTSTAQQREAELSKARLQGQALVAAGLLTEAELVQRIAAIEAKHRAAATSGQRGLTEAEKALREEQKRSADVVALRNKLVEQAFEAQQKLQQAARDAYATDLAQYANSAANAQQRLQDLNDQAEAVAYAERNQISLARAVEITAIARLKEQQVGAMGNEAVVMALQAEIEARQQIVGAVASTEVRDAARALRKSESDEWARTWDQVGQSFTDALMDGGKSAAEYLKGLFRSLVLRPLLAPIGGAMASVFGGPAAAGQGGAGGGLPGAMSTVGMLNNVYNAINTGVSSSITAGFTQLMGSDFGQKIGMSYYDGNAYQLTGTGQSVGNAMGVAGNAMAGYGLQKAISGGYEVGNGNLVDAITIAASAYFGPLAGAVAGVFNRAFGRKLSDTGIEGTFGGEAGFAGQQYQHFKGGWFRSDKTKYSEMDADMSAAFAEQFKAQQLQTAMMAQSLGQGTDAIADFTASVKISFQGLSEEQIAQKLQEQFASTSDAMAGLVLGGSDFAKTGESATQTLTRLSTSLTVVNSISDTLGWTLEAVSLAGGAAASEFADLFGSLDGLAQATSVYYEAFYSQAERNATSTRQLTTELASLGVALPATRDEYRALVDGAMASGNDALAASLLKLSPVFANITASADDLAAQAAQAAQEVASAATDLRSAFAGLLQPLLDAVASARQQVAGAVGTVAGLPAPTLQQLRDQVAAQQVTLPSADGVLGAKATADAAYQQLAGKNAATATAQAQRDSALNTSQLTTAQSLAASAAFANTKTSIVAAEAAENAAFARLGFAYGGGFTVDANGKPVWSNTEKNGQANWATNGWQQQDALAAMRGGTGSQWGAYLREGAAMPVQDPSAPWNRLDSLGKQYGTDLAALNKAQAAQTAATTALASASATLASATTARAQAQAAVDAAVAAQVQAQADYAAALRGYVADASKAVDKLGDLREKTVAYYQAQKQLADGMLASSQQLRTAAQTMRYGQLSTGQTLALQQAEFAQAYSLALSTTGTVQAGYADKMAALLPSLSEAVRASTSSRTEWAVATAGLYAQSQRVANSVAANVPQDYQAESLAVLGQIDGTLAAIEAATSSAEKIISDAIFESGGQTLAGLRGVIAAIKGESIPAFATGAAFSGGVVSRPTVFNAGLMGEAGPEAILPLANMGGQLGVRMAGTGQAAVVAELRAARAALALIQAELAGLRGMSGETALAVRRMARDTKSWSLDGLVVKNKAGEPLFTQAVAA